MLGHNLKIRIEFCNSVLDGTKCFEVRENDRGFQKGDTVMFNPVDKMGFHIPHEIETKVYEITYVLSGWGIKEGYVVFGIKELA